MNEYIAGICPTRGMDLREMIFFHYFSHFYVVLGFASKMVSHSPSTQIFKGFMFQIKHSVLILHSVEVIGEFQEGQFLDRDVL
jgi:hypothetical protein